MKKISFILFFWFNNIFAGNVQQYHQLFINAGQSEKGIEQFNRSMKNEKSKDYISTAYLGVSEMMAASLAWNPYTKLKMFNDGKEILENVISKNNNVAELRFLRLSVQIKCPALLGYNSKINEDKAIVLKSISNHSFSSDNNFTLIARKFLLENLTLTEHEKNTLNG